MRRLLNNTNGYNGFFPGDHVLLTPPWGGPNRNGVVITIEQYRQELPNSSDPIDSSGDLAWMPVREEGGDANGWNPMITTLVRRRCKVTVIGNELRMEE